MARREGHIMGIDNVGLGRWRRSNMLLVDSISPFFFLLFGLIYHCFLANTTNAIQPAITKSTTVSSFARFTS